MEKEKEFSTTKVWVLIAVGTLALLFVGCQYFWSRYPSDNVIEQAVEKAIAEKTGIQVDLSPD